MGIRIPRAESVIKCHERFERCPLLKAFIDRDEEELEAQRYFWRSAKKARAADPDGYQAIQERMRKEYTDKQ